MQTAALADVYAAPGPFATAFLDVSHDSENGDREHELRVRAACESLTAQGADETVVSAVQARLGELVSRSAPASRLVVANRLGVLFDDLAGTRVDQPLATWGPLPDLGAWLAHKDSVSTFVLALVDHEGGDVAVYDSDVPEPEEESTRGGETHRAHKVPTGGWSALRYQHVTENVWARNAQDVAEQVNTHVLEGAQLVLLAGDPQSRPIVRDALDQHAIVVELETGTRAEDGGDEALQQAIREALLEQTVQRRLSINHELKDRLGRDHAVATGVRDVADAFVRGQVDTLLIDPTAAAEVPVDPGDHPGLVIGSEVPPGPLPAGQALVAAAVLTSAEVAVVPRAALGGAPLAALLRWDQDAVGTEA